MDDSSENIESKANYETEKKLGKEPRYDDVHDFISIPAILICSGIFFPLYLNIALSLTDSLFFSDDQMNTIHLHVMIYLGLIGLCRGVYLWYGYNKWQSQYHIEFRILYDKTKQELS